MNPNILFINPPVLLGEKHIDNPLNTVLGVVLNASVLREKEFEISIADSFSAGGANVDSDRDGVLIGAPLESLLSSFQDKEPETIVFVITPYMVPHLKTEYVQTLFDTIRKHFPEASIVGADCNYSGMHYIEYDGNELLKSYPELKAVLKYESESCLPTFLSGEIETVKVVKCDASEIEPDDLPYPAWDLISVEEYFRCRQRYHDLCGVGSRIANLRSLPVISSRGCPYNCHFCTSNPGQSKRSWRANSPEYMHGLLSHLKQKYELDAVEFLDSTPNVNLERFLEILQIIKKLSLKCSFPNGLRADCLRKKHIELLRDVALDVNISAESAIKKNLEYLRKTVSTDDIERVAGWCNELGVPLGIHYMIGIPGETPEEANTTLDHALEMKKRYGANPLLQLFVPIPGSPAYEEMKSGGSIGLPQDKDIYKYFNDIPAIDTEDFPASEKKMMIDSFQKRIDDSKLEKIIINLTYKCLNDCVFCAIGDRAKEHGDLKRYCDIMIKHRELGIQSIDFDGGEPTLFPHFLRIVKFAKEIGYNQINVTTNARRLADRGFASRFLLSGLTSVLVSLHGHNGEMHEWHTRSSGSFQETLEGIHHIIELRPKRIEFAINTTLTDRNAPHLEEFLQFVDGLGVQKVNLQFLTPNGNAGSFDEYDVESIIDNISETVMKWSEKLDITLVNLPPCLAENITGVLAPDTGKYSRKMVFVDTEPMNLGNYLDKNREKKEFCRKCPLSSGCAGYYVF